MPRGASEQLELELTRRKSRPPTKRKSAPADAESLLDLRDALLTRSHLRALGLERRAVDAVFGALPVVALPGYSRPLIRALHYVEFVAANTYRGDRVRPIASSAGAVRVG